MDTASARRVSSVRVIALLLAGLGQAALPRPAAAAAATSAAMQPATGPASRPADTVILDARIYTSAKPEFAEALAVRAGRIVYVGNGRGARAWVGPKTRVERLHGRLVIPGLVDAHTHPVDTVDLDVCDLDNRPLDLARLTAFVRACRERFHVAPGQRLLVHQWNFSAGNQPDEGHPTLRSALDQAGADCEIQLLGNDAHHGAFNSLALARARNARGEVVGLSAATLAGELAGYRAWIGVDARGEPDGQVNEDARYLINPRSMMYIEYDRVLADPAAVARHYNAAGITTLMDAMVPDDGYPLWDKLAASGHLTLRATLAQFHDPSHMLTPAGDVDYDGMVARAVAVRARYAGHPRLRADFIKLFADGVAEGNPLADPPTLGNAAMLAPYLQPMFSTDASGRPVVTGYVDTASPACVAARAHPEQYASAADGAAFLRANGFHPAQCAISSGRLQHERGVEMEYVRRMHLAGFNLHIHAIGDRAVRTAIDAIEEARAADGNARTHDSLAHVQFAAPEDVARIGRDHLYVAYTYSWAVADPDYDMTVIPFLQEVHGNSHEARYPPGGFYEARSYPVRSTQAAGATLVAGSDAPVGTRDPQPFVNMSAAVTRHLSGQPALNPGESIPIRAVLAAYTVDGARFLGWDGETGSLEVGKSADFVVVDRDIVRLADSGHADDIADAKALETWFMGERVYRAARPAGTTRH